jgi:uncharacterized phage protein (TIGR02218 family)
MAVITETIGDSPSDHLTIADWVTATSLNLVANGDIMVGELKDQVHEINMGDVVISGATVDASNYRILKAPTGSNFKPYDLSGPAVYAQMTNGAVDESAIEIREKFFVMQGIGFMVETRKLLASGSDSGIKIGVDVKREGVIVDSCFVKMDQGGKVGDSLFYTNYQFEGDMSNDVLRSYAVNCIAMGSPHPIGAQLGFYWGNYATFGGAWNCTANNINRSVGRGFQALTAAGNEPNLVNCIATNCQSTCFGGLWGSIVKNNISSDTTAGALIDSSGLADQDAIINQASSTLFLNDRAQDFRLKITSPALNTGSDQTAALVSVLGVALDIEGTPRIGAWERGAYEGYADPVNNALTVVEQTIGVGKDFADIDLWLTATEVSCYFNSTQYVGVVYDQAADYSAASNPYRAQRAVTTSRFYRTLRAFDANEAYQPRADVGVKLIGTGGSGSGNTQVMDIREDYFRLARVGIIQNSIDASSRKGLTIFGHNCEIDATFVKAATGTGSSTYNVQIVGYNTRITNTIAKGSGTTAGASVGFLLGATVGSNLFNCIAERITSGAGHGFEEAAGSKSSRIENCISVNNTLDYQHGTGQVPGVTQSHNMSEDSSAAGPNSITGVSPLAVMKAPVLSDYRLIAGSAAINAGSNLTPFFSADFNFKQRFAPFDLGVYEGFADAPLLSQMSPEAQRTHRTISTYEIIRKDGFTLYLTDANAPISHQGQIFESAAGVAVSSHRREVSLKETSREMLGVITSDKITTADLAAKRYRGATVIERRLDHRFPFAAPVETFVFTIQEVDFDEETWTAQLAGQAAKLGQRIGETVGHLCPAKLGDPLTCKADIELATLDAVAVTTVEADVYREFRAVSITIASEDDEYGNGAFVWLSGANSGIETVCKTYTKVGRIIKLDERMPNAIEIGDTFRLEPGCRRRYLADCIGKFANGINFQAEPFIPGTDRALETPSR